LVGVLVWLTTAVVAAQAPPGDWRDASAYLPLFGPSGPRAEAYRIYVSPLDIRTLVKRVTSDPSSLHPPDAWVEMAVLPSDAFGQTGGYDRSKLARLYGARRALVARGPRGAADRPTESWTLISPYPSGDMERLEPGTMLIVVNLAFP
jgi:hypothetical protein